jgi:ubiquitin carboxyl-terminal hydrolase 10
MAPTTEQTVLPMRYMLYGVLYHHGTSANGGDYTVDVLHLNAHCHDSSGSEGTWLCIDDENVSTVHHEDVFGRHENVDSWCAYLLFYCCTTTCTQT